MQSTGCKPRSSFDLLVSLEEGATLFFWAAARAFRGTRHQAVREHLTALVTVALGWVMKL